MAKSSTQNEAVYTIRIDRGKLQRLHEIAVSEHRTLAGEIRVLLDRRITEHEERQAA